MTSPGRFEQQTVEQHDDDIGFLRAANDLLSEAYTVNDITATQVPNTPAQGLIHYSSVGQHKYSSSDSNAYNTGRLTLPASSNPTINSVSFTLIPGLTCELAAGVTYRVSGQVIVTPNQAAGAAELQFVAGGGLTFTGARVAFREYISPNPGVWSPGQAAFITTTGATFTSAVFGAGTPPSVFEFDGIMIVGTTGTISLEAACTIAADTFGIVQWGTYMQVEPIS